MRGRSRANLGLAFQTISIAEVVAATETVLGPVFAGRPRDVTEENIQARVRGVLMMALSNKFGSLLLTTGNKSEMAVGYCTLYGDMGGGLAVISDVFKTQIYALARWINDDARRAGRVAAHSPELDRQAAVRRAASGPDRPGQPAALRPARRHPARIRRGGAVAARSDRPGICRKPRSTTSCARSISTNTSASRPPPA